MGTPGSFVFCQAIRLQRAIAILKCEVDPSLSLPSSIIESLELPWIFRDAAPLGDGSEVLFDMDRATVIWHGQYQVVDVAASETEALVGMGLLYRSKLQIEAVEGGIVRIESMA